MAPLQCPHHPPPPAPAPAPAPLRARKHPLCSAPGWRPCRRVRTAPPLHRNLESSKQRGRIKVSKCRGLSLSCPPTRSGAGKLNPASGFPGRRDTRVARLPGSPPHVTRTSALAWCGFPGRAPWLQSLLRGPEHAGTSEPGSWWWETTEVTIEGSLPVSD